MGTEDYKESYELSSSESGIASNSSKEPLCPGTPMDLDLGDAASDTPLSPDEATPETVDVTDINQPSLTGTEPPTPPAQPDSSSGEYKEAEQYQEDQAPLSGIPTPPLEPEDRVKDDIRGLGDWAIGKGLEPNPL